MTPISSQVWSLCIELSLLFLMNWEAFLGAELMSLLSVLFLFFH